MNKDELLDALEDSRENFLDVIDGLPEEDLLLPGVIGEWSIKDLMIHISMWEAELVKLLWQLRQGQKPSTIHFSDQSVDEVNAAWQQVYQERSLEQALADFHGVRKQTIRRVEAFSNQELIDTDRFPQIKGTPLWEWIKNDSFDHEAEHGAQIQAWRKEH